MAQQVLTVLVDDLDESEASQTLTFGLDGVQYEIDLNDEHAEALREAFSVYVDAGRRVGGRSGAGRSGRSAGRSASSSGDKQNGAAVDTKAVRAWAAENGHELKQRGRIPTKVIDAYLAAQ